MENNFQAQIQVRTNSVVGLVRNIVEEHEKNGETINTINKIHEKVRQDEKVTNTNKQKLKSLYNSAISEAESEEELIRKALGKIYEIRAIKNERRIAAKQSGNRETVRRGALMKALQTAAQTLPLWIGKTASERPPALCGCLVEPSSYISKPGDMVAALQKTPEGDENWILAEVIDYNSITGKYQLDDIDEEQKDKERFSLSRKRVTPLPLMRANPETDPDALFQKDDTVMALYPQTTCFYKAVVNIPPRFHNDEYEVLFEDSTYSEGYSPPLKVAQRYVIAIREKRMK